MVNIIRQWLLCWLLLLSPFTAVGLADNDLYVKQLLQLADQGDGEAQLALALLYEYGEQGLARDPEKALSWFLQAGKSGIPAACLYLGIKFENGSGALRNPGAAAQWYCCAARKGWAMAQFLLAELYRQGKGVAADHCRALAWYGLAAEQGYPGAQEAVQQLTEKMNDADREKAAAISSAIEESALDCRAL